MTHIAGLGTELPPYKVDAEWTKAWLAHRLPPAAAGRWQQRVEGSGIRTRYAVEQPEYASHRTPAERSASYKRHVRQISRTAAEKALRRSGIAAEDISALVFASSTGYALPSIDAHLVADLHAPATARRVPLVGLGCAGGLAGLSLAGELAAQRRAPVLLVCAEAPSVWLGTHEPTPQDTGASITFADGAAAVLISPDARAGAIEILATRTTLWPEGAQMRTAELTSTGLRHGGTGNLMRLLRERLSPAVRSFLEEQGMARDQLAFCAIHPADPAMLDLTAAGLGLSPTVAAPSRAAWERCGQISSAGVFFALEGLPQIPSETETGLLLAVGPGICCEMVLVRRSPSRESR